MVSGWRAFGAGEETDRPVLPPPAKRKIDFWQDIEPIFRERCQNCHGPEKQMAGLRLDNRTDALKGGDSGPVIRPGNSAKSKLIQAVSGLGEGVLMPFAAERLSAEQVGVLRAWIDQGAEWPVEPKHPTDRPKCETRTQKHQ
jgi:hypothetical protein